MEPSFFTVNININFLGHSMYALNRKVKSTVFQETCGKGDLIFQRETKKQPFLFSDWRILLIILHLAQLSNCTKGQVRIKDVCDMLNIEHNGAAQRRIINSFVSIRDTKIFIRDFYNEGKYTTENFRFLDRLSIQKGVVSYNLNDRFFAANQSGYVKPIDFGMYLENSPLFCRMYEYLSPKLWSNSKHPLCFITLHNLGKKIGLSDCKQSNVDRTIFDPCKKTKDVFFVDMRKKMPLMFEYGGSEKNTIVIFAGTNNPRVKAQLVLKDERLKKYCDLEFPGDEIIAKDTVKIEKAKTIEKPKVEPKKPESAEWQIRKKIEQLTNDYPETKSVHFSKISFEKLVKNFDAAVIEYGRQRAKINNPNAWFKSVLEKGCEVNEIKQVSINTGFYNNHVATPHEIVTEKINKALENAGDSWQQEVYAHVKVSYPDITAKDGSIYNRKETVLGEILYYLIDRQDNNLSMQEITDYLNHVGQNCSVEDIKKLNWSV